MRCVSAVRDVINVIIAGLYENCVSNKCVNTRVRQKIQIKKIY